MKSAFGIDSFFPLGRLSSERPWYTSFSVLPIEKRESKSYLIGVELRLLSVVRICAISFIRTQAA